MVKFRPAYDVISQHLSHNALHTAHLEWTTIRRSDSEHRPAAAVVVAVEFVQVGLEAIEHAAVGARESTLEGR